MESSNTLSWKSSNSQNYSRGVRIGREILSANSTKELVEFYWTNRKRFSEGSEGFPSEVN
tara:strand:+ start:87 stop:266 length:180 start_codon:yes stop_codon:yes gene_type:complete